MATVYKILSPCLQECYVGSTIMTVEKRWWFHKSKGNTTNSKNLFEKYGVENCKFVVMEVCPLEEQRIKEQWWLDHSVGAINEKKAFLTDEEKIAQKTIYHIENREKYLAQMKERYEENKDTVCANLRAKRQTNSDEYNAYQRAWRASNKESYNAKNRAYRASKKKE